MRRVIPSGRKQALDRFEPLPRLPADLVLTLDPRINRGALTSLVKAGDPVAQGQVIAESENLKLHAPRAGTVSAVNDGEIQLADLQAPPPNTTPYPAPASPTELPEFAASMGLVGMGGSMFPYAIKFKAAKNIHTLVINSVECEPGIEIDECLLHSAPESIAAGIELITSLFDCKETVLAIKKGSRISSASIATNLQILHMPRSYPAGAEKLITRKLAGRMPPTGVLPVHWGYLVMSVASLWAIGRRLQHGHAAVDRPLSLIAPGQPTRNLNVPIGTAVQDLLAAFNIAYDPAHQMLVAGGQMMGRHVQPDFRVLKGTNALFVHPVPARLRRPEQPCVLCSSCFDACPLHLHPIGMADRIKQRKHSKALAAQLNECFLCGACSAVCPADIPLVEYFQQGKQWLRERS